MQEVDLMLNVEDLSDDQLNNVVAKLVALGYNDFHGGRITLVRRGQYFAYLCVEVEGYTTNDVCLCTCPNATDVVAASVDDLLIKAAEYVAKKEAQ